MEIGVLWFSANSQTICVLSIRTAATMVTLVAMTQEELDKYLETSIQALAAELMRANGWTSPQSLAASLKSFNALLPDRIVDSPNQFLRTICANGQKVGILWFGIRDEKEAIVWDILIHPSHRRKGYGRAAMVAMEEELRIMNINSVVLNVFAHNSIASTMYLKLGYTPVSTKMSKRMDKRKSTSDRNRQRPI